VAKCLGIHVHVGRRRDEALREEADDQVVHYDDEVDFEAHCDDAASNCDDGDDARSHAEEEYRD